MSRRTPSPQALAACLVWAFSASAPAPAEVFRSVDDSGATQFSERREAGAQRVEKVKTAGPKPQQPAAKEPVIHSGSGTMTLDIKGKTKEQAKPKPTKEQLAQMKEICEKAKLSASQLSGENGVRTNRLQYVDKNGERSFMTEEQVQERLKEMKQKIKDYCVK